MWNRLTLWIHEQLFLLRCRTVKRKLLLMRLELEIEALEKA